mgnify:CR=1 FL=1
MTSLEPSSYGVVVVPQSPTLLLTVLLQPGMMLLAYLVGRLTRRVLRRWHTTLSSSAATLTALLGLWGGLAVGTWIFTEDYLWAPRLLVCALATAVTVIIITSFVATWLQREPELEPIAAVAARGESATLEFKSSARVNLRTGKRDDVIETVAAKTVAAFLNSRGGTLLLGVDDAGRLIGLGPDYTTLRHEDADRYELFLRDLWRVRLGANAAALPRLDFAPAADGDGEVCRITVPPSPAPVYLSGPKGKGGRELWVRAGNSTQRLEIDDAITYVSQRWPHTVRPSWRSRIGAYLLYHRRPAGAPADGDQTPGGLIG